MLLFRTKTWSVIDIGLLKWSCILFGMLIGAYFSGCTKRFMKPLFIAAILLAIKAAISYFQEDNPC